MAIRPKALSQCWRFANSVFHVKQVPPELRCLCLSAAEEGEEAQKLRVGDKDL